MPAISAANLTYMESPVIPVKHYLAVCPRTSVFSGQIADVTFSDSGGVVQIEYTDTGGSAGDVKAGMTIDFGSSAGSDDRGRARVKAVDTGSSTITIGEISYPEVPFDINDYFTVRDEYLLHQVRPRRVENGEDDHIEYNDYDVAYSNQNENIAPVANITKSGAYTFPDLAGFVDSGQTYRTMTLDASQSVALNPDATSTLTYAWDVGDCTITSGTSSSESITLRVPQGFRHISLTVTDSVGTASPVRYLPLWTFDANNPPLTGFQVAERTQTEGWTLKVRFVDPAADSIDETVIPKGTLCYFWEDVSRDQYVGRMMGWSTSETTLLQLHKTRTTFTIQGAHWWLNQLDGFAQTVTKADSPANWSQMAALTPNLLLHYILRRYTTFLSVCNFHPFASDPAIPDETISGGTIWKQLLNIAQKHQMGEGICDALGGLYLTHKFSYRSSSDRGSTAVMLATTADHWVDAAPPAITEDYTRKTGFVIGEGAAIISGEETRFASTAPASVPASAPGTRTMPFQYLPDTTSQTVLNRLTGQHFAQANKTGKPSNLQLTGNADFIDRAWGERITRTWAYDNPRGYSESAADYTVMKISVVYNYSRGQKPKQIIWAVDPATDGMQGFAKAIARNPRIVPTSEMAFIDAAGKLLLTTDFDMPAHQGGPTYTTVDLTQSPYNLLGDVVQFKVDPFCSGVVNLDGGSIDAIVVTTQRIYHLTDIFDTGSGRTLTSVHTFRATESLRSLDISKAADNRAIVVTSYSDGCYETHSSDLTTWTTEAQYGSGSAQASSGGGTYDFNIESYSADWDSDVSALGSWGASNRYGTTNAWKPEITAPAINQQKILRETTLDTAATITEMTITYDWYATNAQAQSMQAYIKLYYDGVGSPLEISLPVHRVLESGGADGWESISETWTGSQSDVTKIEVGFTVNDFTAVTQEIDWKTFDHDGSSGVSSDTNNPPGVYASNLSVGRVYTSGAISSGSDTDGFVSTDNGATLSQITTPNIDPDENLMADIGVLQAGNFDAETILYHGAVVSGGRALKKVLLAGSSVADLTPTVSSETYGPWLSLGQLQPHPLDGNMAIFILGNADKSLAGLWTTIDGETLVERITPMADVSTGRYHRAFPVGNGSYQVILLGTHGAIGFSPDWCQTFESKTGDINQSTIDEIIGLAWRYPPA